MRGANGSHPETLDPDDTATAISRIADDVGADDIFVFRRVQDDRYVHVGGHGRAHGWEGNVELRLSEGGLACEAVSRRRPQRIAWRNPHRIFGPYFACGAAAVAVGSDVIVFFGARSRPLPSCADDRLAHAASDMDRLVGLVSPAKRLADELELLHALNQLMAFRGLTSRDALSHIVAVAGEALSCDIGVVYLRSTGEVVTWSDGAQPTLDRTALRAALEQVWRAPVPRCEQDSAIAPLPGPLGPDDGVRSYLCLEIGGPAEAIMVLCHTDARPRGFTLLCQAIGTRIAREAGALLERTRARYEDLETARAETAGRLVGGVAHDLNNLLTLIGSYTSFVVEDLDPDDPRRADLAEASRATDRARSLVARLTAFARGDAAEERISLNDIIAGMDGLLRAALGKRTPLETWLEPDLPPISMDRRDAELMIAGLVLDANEASSGGTIELTTGAADVDGEPCVRVAVTVSGSGLEGEPHPRRGIAAATAIIVRTGGRVRSEPGPKGSTTVELLFPATLSAEVAE